ncbi:DUF979 domain-containing protein [Helcococcus kunzii]|uniref:DUF979 domain-containing protein n=1 Tax=Helcococcus kunzii TaxID=40091 RepID=UPI001C940300|nr:DUF979 domain-containing protein [Helcococcus kunzii]MCT1795961.1 DUF979 domain-containing protein [Helcococcus kunzii]MCT1988263.1 DUF979 domain-containing protein [Helcococcus kunzii]QZO75901.1 DUF979 domain-containing protein [Helcococcus kunzii]
MLEFFNNPDIAIGTKLLEIVYFLIGLILIYVGINNLQDKENPKSATTALFWGLLGVVIAFGRWIPEKYVGILILIMAVPPIFNLVKPGKNDIPTDEYTEKMSNKIGYKIFIPALMIGLFAILFATVFTKLGALVGVTLGVICAAITLKIMNNDTTISTFLADNKRLLDMVGPLCMLPMFLASLGAIFTEAGVGEVIANLVGNIIPKGNVNVGIIVFAIGMVLFTMIMGNAFAAITVMTVGIGAPFVLQYGADPALIGMLALTTGYCGTLMTPMAANFNIVPVAILEMEDKNGVIKNQIIPALIMIVVQIVYMIIFK